MEHYTDLAIKEHIFLSLLVNEWPALQARASPAQQAKDRPAHVVGRESQPVLIFKVAQLSRSLQSIPPTMTFKVRAFFSSFEHSHLQQHHYDYVITTRCIKIVNRVN